MLNCLKLLSNLIRKELLPVKAFYFKSFNKQLDRNQKFISVEGGFLRPFRPFFPFPSLPFLCLSFPYFPTLKWPLKYRGKIWGTLLAPPSGRERKNALFCVRAQETCLDLLGVKTPAPRNKM